VQNAVQQVGGAIGHAVLATIALRHTSHAIASGVDQATAAVDGYSLAFRVAAVVLFLGAIASALFMSRHVRATPVQPGMEEFEFDSEPAAGAGVGSAASLATADAAVRVAGTGHAEA
jgi:hypothetical protein